VNGLLADRGNRIPVIGPPPFNPLLDEGRQTTLVVFGGRAKERRQVVADDTVERGMLRGPAECLELLGS
jgi:hypothetical protein